MKDNLAALEGLGFTLPSTAYVIGIVIFGIGGYFAYRYGKKMSLPATKRIGIALMLYPYVISATWLLYAVGAALCIGAYVSARGKQKNAAVHLRHEAVTRAGDALMA